MATIHVEVTQEDIERGIPEDGACCPIAHAFRRAWGRKIEFAVDYASIEIYALCNHSAELPKEAKEFIDAFDNARDVHPIAFDVTVPDGELL